QRRVRQPALQWDDGGGIAGEASLGESVDLIDRQFHLSLPGEHPVAAGSAREAPLSPGAVFLSCAFLRSAEAPGRAEPCRVRSRNLHFHADNQACASRQPMNTILVNSSSMCGLSL